MVWDKLKHIIGSHPQTVLSPVGFFVARSGVLTLAYEGFCSSVLNIKREIAALDAELTPEYEGSMWPKTSLAALREGAHLSLDDIEKLHSLCHSWDEYIRANAQQLRISDLYVIEYDCRSLERTRSETQIELSGNGDDESDFLPLWHLKNVDDVLAQFNIDNLHAYASQIQHSGNHESHYRSDASGTTLVIKPHIGQLEFIDSFRKEVDTILPGRYAWFDKSSLHITVRNLFN